METVVCLVQFGLPCLIVLVCMVLQMDYIKKAFGDHENPLLNMANQVNLTVFLISLLYLSSVSLYYLVTYPLVEYTNQILPEPLQVLLQLTLPLINAALFPTILILRKPEMRARYRNYIAKVLLEKVLLLPLTISYLWKSSSSGSKKTRIYRDLIRTNYILILGKVYYLAQRRQGYIQKFDQNYFIHLTSILFPHYYFRFITLI